MEQSIYSHEEISRNIELNKRRRRNIVKDFLIYLTILMLLLFCWYMQSSLPLMANIKEYEQLINDIIDIPQFSPKEMQQKYKEILSLVLYQPFNGTWISNTTIQGNNATQGIIQLIFRQYTFSSLFNYDLVLYDYEGNEIPQGIILSNNEAFSATRIQSNSMNISIDKNVFTLSSTQSITIKSISKYTSRLIMVTSPAKFQLSLNKLTMTGYISLEMENVSIIIDIGRGKIDYYNDNWYIIFNLYHNCYCYITSLLRFNILFDLPPLISPYTVLFYSIYNGAMLYQVSHLMFINKLYLYYLPLFLIEIVIALYSLPMTLLYIINNQIYTNTTSEDVNRQKRKQIAICVVLYVIIISLLITSMNCSYCFRWRIVYYIFLIATYIPQIIHIRNYNDDILKYFNGEIHHSHTSKIYLIFLQSNKANVFMYANDSLDTLVSMLILLIELIIILYLKFRNWIKINIFKMQWYKCYYFLKELGLKDKFECSICLYNCYHHYIEKESNNQSINNALVIYKPPLIKIKQGKYTQFKSALYSWLFKKRSNENTVNNARLFLMLCHHTFHADCLVLWLKINNSCPLCRKIIL